MDILGDLACHGDKLIGTILLTSLAKVKTNAIDVKPEEWNEKKMLLILQFRNVEAKMICQRGNWKIKVCIVSHVRTLFFRCFSEKPCQWYRRILFQREESTRHFWYQVQEVIAMFSFGSSVVLARDQDDGRHKVAVTG